VGGGIRLVDPIDRQDADLHRSPLGAAGVVATGVDQEPMEPGVEAVRVAQGAEVPPSTDEGVLDSVLGGRGIAQDPPGDRVQAVIRAAHEVFEGLVIAPLRSGNELSDHPHLGDRDADTCRDW
jgi:hypothetical protein